MFDAIKNFWNSNKIKSYAPPINVGGQSYSTSGGGVDLNKAQGGLTPMNTQPSSTGLTTFQSVPQTQNTATPMPQGPGSPQAAATQQQSDLQKYFPDLASMQGSNSPQIPSKNFSINPPDGVINSSSANPTTTTNDALAAAAQNRQALLSGTSPANFVPSDTLLGSVASNLYNQSLYSPEEQQALQQYNDTQSRIIQTQLAARRQLQALQENGALTKEQAQGFLTEAQRRSDAQLADLAAHQSGNTLSLQTLGMLRQNNIGALQNLASLIKPTEISPGSSLITPFGQVVGQATGASPAQVAATAQQLEQSAIQSGNIATNPDGTINHNFYLSQAQQYYQTGNYGQGGGTGQFQNTGQQTGTTQQPQTQIAPAYQAYVDQSVDGIPFVSEDRLNNLTPFQKQEAARQYAAAGVRVLTTGETQALNSIDDATANVNLFEQAANKLLSPGLLGRIQGFTTNQFKQFTQSDPDWRQFQTLRAGLIKSVQGIAAGAPGLRVTGAELQNAAEALPNSFDNLESAQTAINTFKSLLNINKNILFRNGQTASQPSGQNIIQTKVGAIDNSWFQ